MVKTLFIRINRLLIHSTKVYQGLLSPVVVVLGFVRHITSGILYLLPIILPFFDTSLGWWWSHRYCETHWCTWKITDIKWPIDTQSDQRDSRVSENATPFVSLLRKKKRLLNCVPRHQIAVSTLYRQIWVINLTPLFSFNGSFLHKNDTLAVFSHLHLQFSLTFSTLTGLDWTEKVSHLR